MAFHLVHRFSGQQIAGFLPFDKMAQGREHPTRLKINGEIETLRNASPSNSQKGLMEIRKATRCTMPDNPMEAYTGYQQGFVVEEAYSDSFFHPEIEYLGHASENENRVPFSAVEDLWDSDENREICHKALLITRENYIPTSNFNTSIGMYRRSKRQSHHMRTRSQTREKP
ncbi:unnamed protein product [Cuscuta europaea]|uniref:Uncharacterized protein n=1 Tax=Cuscuta europaea TaxID=41803 RepID=A0A9P1E6Y6_CUSEU|nr:unnamed protein product [Cuscuta europaea]